MDPLSSSSHRATSTPVVAQDYGFKLWGKVAGLATIASLIASAVAQPLQQLADQAATWSISCCMIRQGSWDTLCRYLTIPSTNETMTNIIQPAESLFANTKLLPCEIYDQIIAHGSDYSTFVLSVPNAAPALLSMVATVVSTVALMTLHMVV